ncbi:STAS domain-containing protein [Amycolatopsis rhabdoformis]|uniref:Anti-sigma factor antagonist n=1 Tax=Amycolatopsis rhabdoformis TaxID=1448059 RepID=A0ABZ1IFX9_9PSEU|nr:STAS domain-containing protein [Amycolatopsis rhabdoformis]WSE33361.1 STAS domain-containing protein [Amycolatopsis rhabdoformis]
MTDDLRAPGARRLPALDITTATGSGATVVTAAGEIDTAVSDSLRDALAAALEARPEVLVADLSEVPFCDSSGLSALIDIRGRAIEAGTAFRIVTRQRGLLRPISLLHLDTVLEIHPTLDSATGTAAPS